jgi:hypothetical protein
MDLDSAQLSGDQWPENTEDLDGQEQYYKALLRRYEALRDTLANADSKKLARFAEADPSRYTDSKPPSTRKAWLRTLECDFPTLARVVHISEHNLFHALRYCAETLDRYEIISRQKSCWIWTLLALAGEVGTLDHYRIGRIRDLGHKAGQLGACLRSGARRRPVSDGGEDEDEDEEWSVDGEGTTGENEEQNADLEANTVKNHDSDRILREAEEDGEDNEEVQEHSYDTHPNVPFALQNATDSISAQLDGVGERKTDMHPQVEEENDGSDDSTDMSMSEDEGEIRENGRVEVEAEAPNIEEARARLLAQLGDRLIQPSIPSAKRSKQSMQAHHASRQGSRHYHNNKVCRDSDCYIAVTKTKEDQRTEGSGLKSAPPPVTVYPSRAEAEMQRQKMRDEALAKVKVNESLEYEDTPATVRLEATPAFKLSEGSLEAQTNTNGGAEAAHSEPCLTDKVKAKKGEGPGADMEVIDATDLNTRVTVDMILTIVGECYGQRDLLRFREVW